MGTILYCKCNAINYTRGVCYSGFAEYDGDTLAYRVILDEVSRFVNQFIGNNGFDYIFLTF